MRPCHVGHIIPWGWGPWGWRQLCTKAVYWKVARPVSSWRGNHRKGHLYVGEIEPIGDFFIDMFDYQSVLHFILLMKHNWSLVTMVRSWKSVKRPLTLTALLPFSYLPQLLLWVCMNIGYPQIQVVDLHFPHLQGNSKRGDKSSTLGQSNAWAEWYGLWWSSSQVVIITSQAGSVEWRFTQNKGEGLEGRGTMSALDTTGAVR